MVNRKDINKMLLERNAELDCEASVDKFCELPPRSNESPDQPRGALPQHVII